MTRVTLIELGQQPTLSSKLRLAGERISELARNDTSDARRKFRTATAHLHPALVNDMMPPVGAEIEIAKHKFIAACVVLMDGSGVHPLFAKLADRAQSLHARTITMDAWRLVRPGDKSLCRRFIANPLMAQQCDYILHVLEMCKPENSGEEQLRDNAMNAYASHDFDYAMRGFLFRLEDLLKAGKQVSA